MGSETVFLAMTIAKLATALTVSTGLIVGMKYFNSFEWKAKKKKGGVSNADEIESLLERTRTKG